MKIEGKHYLLAILILAALLRLPNLYTIPFWEADEGYNLNYAWNLSEGRMMWYSIKYAFIPHPPLFYMILAVIIKIFGYTLYPARIFAVLLGLCNIALLYKVGKKLVNEKTGLVAALLYAIYPNAIFFGRMNYNNNLIALMIMLAMYAYLSGGRWRIMSHIIMGLSAIVEFTGASLLASAFMLSGVFERKNFPRNMAITLAPGVVFTLAMLYITPTYFIHDLNFQLQRFGFTPLVFGASAILLTAFYLTAEHFSRIYACGLDLLRKELTILFSEYSNLVWNNGTLIILTSVHFYTSRLLVHPLSEGYIFGSFEYFWTALAGLILIKDSAKRNTTLLFTLPILAVTFKIGRLDHMCIPLYPLFCLGGGVLLVELNSFLQKVSWLLTSKKMLVFAASTLLLAYPFVYVLYLDLNAFTLGNTLKPEDVNSMMETADYLNSRITPNDIVLVAQHMERFIKGNASIFIQGIAINHPILYYPDLSQDRFAYNISYQNAKYIAIPSNDGLSWLATVDNGTFRNISLEIEGWGVEREIGPYYIYRNPSK